MRALITGVGGFVGPYLANVLVSHGIQVFGLDRHALFQGSVIHYQVDILDTKKLKALMKTLQPNYIFHLAGVSSVQQSWANSDLTYKINVKGTNSLVQSIPKKLHTKILFISTAEVYGIPKKIPITEEHNVHPQNPYGKSKLEAEKIIQDSGFEYIISRSFQHIGPGQRLGFVCSDFAKQIVDIEKGKQEPVLRVGNLHAKRDFTDVRDIVKAYFIAITRGDPGQIYNICSGKGYLIKDILYVLLQLSKLTIKVEEDPQKIRPVKIPIQIGDNTKFVKQTGWHPAIPIHKTLQDIIDYWRQQP